MKYCLSSRLAPRFLREADEIKVQFRDRKSIPDLYHKYGKPIILFPGDVSEYDWAEMRQYDLLCNSNLILNLSHLELVQYAKENKIKFMLNTEATSYWELEGLQNLGAEYAYVGIPLFFDLEHTLNFDIQIRAIPTVAYNHTLPHKDGVCGQWIRPEDVEEYEDYIQVLEFEPCDIVREQTLFKVYAQDKEWRTRLDILVEDLGSPAINRMIMPEVIETRLKCRQSCKSGGRCHMCYTALKLADPDFLPKPKDSIVEK